MTSIAAQLRTRLDDAPEDFSIILGGPLFQLLRRAHIAGDALELVRRRMVLMALLAWLPLLLLAAMEGNALGGAAAVPFVYDLQVHARNVEASDCLEDRGQDLAERDAGDDAQEHPGAEVALESAQRLARRFGSEDFRLRRHGSVTVSIRKD